jgi:hypothetical protein
VGRDVPGCDVDGRDRLPEGRTTAYGRFRCFVTLTLSLVFGLVLGRTTRMV